MGYMLYFRVFLKKEKNKGAPVYLYEIHASYVQLEILESERADPCCEDEHVTLSNTGFLAVGKKPPVLSVHSYLFLKAEGSWQELGICSPTPFHMSTWASVLSRAVSGAALWASTLNLQEVHLHLSVCLLTWDLRCSLFRAAIYLQCIYLCD